MIILTKVGKLGYKDPKWGQKYWCEVEDSDLPVMFNSMSDFSEGDQIAYEESSQEKTKDGSKDYLKLKKVKKVQSDLPDTKSQQKASTAVSGITKEQGDEIIRLLKKLNNEEATVSSEDINKEIRLEDIPF